MEYDNKELQEKILEVILYIDKLCKANNIEYYLLGGSALGAVRHQGFIPWDDDLDICMTFDNYYKFINLCEEKLDTEKYYLQKEFTEEWPMWFTKIRTNNTTYIEELNKGKEMHQGIFVDVFCLNKVSNNKFMSYLQYICGRTLTALGLSKRGYKGDTLMKKIVILIMKLFPYRYTSKILKNFIQRYNRQKVHNIAHLAGKAKYSKCVYPCEVIGEPQRIIFENYMLPVPEKVEQYLTLRFGDYMELPPASERSKAIHAEFVDIHNDYSDYT